jgi:hypothetical protein
MRNQAPALAGRGRVLAGAEDDVATQRVRASLDRPSIAGRASVRVNAHFAEVEAEARLKVAAHLARQGRTRAWGGFHVRRWGGLACGLGLPHWLALWRKGVHPGLTSDEGLQA